MDRKVDALWRVTDDFDIDTPNGPLTVYMRTISDTQNDQRVKEGMAAARMAKIALEDEDSDEYRWHIRHLLGLKRDALLAQAREIRRIRAIRASFTEVFPKSWPEPTEDATVEDTILVEEQREQIENDVTEARTKYVEGQITAYDAEVDGLSDEQLLAQALEEQTTSVVNAAFSKSMDAATLFYACYKNDRFKRKLFNSVADVMDANGEVTEQLVTKYRELDRWTRDAEGLKKSPVSAE